MWATKSSGYKYCWFHDPNIDEKEKKKARAKGGKRVKKEGLVRIYSDIKEMQLEKINDIEEVMKVVIKNMAAGTISIEEGKVLMDSLKTLFSVMEKTGDWRKKIEELLKDAKKG